MIRLFLRDLSFAGRELDVSHNGDIQLIEGVKNLRQALFHRLITVKGSLVHRPNYGIGIKQYQNRIARLDTQRELSLEIRKQFLEDPRVKTVDSISFQAKPDGSFIVRYRIITVGLGELTFNEEIGGL